jgi:hypothetical protein
LTSLTGSAYLAVALSKTQKLSDDDFVFECVNYKNEVSAYVSKWKTIFGSVRQSDVSFFRVQ